MWGKFKVWFVDMTDAAFDYPARRKASPFRAGI